MTIIRTPGPRPGWHKARQLPQFLTCEKCGAVCDEASAEAHDLWHADVDMRMLPSLSDFITLTAPEPISA